MKIVIVFCAIYFHILSVFGQYWTQQNTNFIEDVVGVNQISIVDSNIVWVNGFNGSGSGAKIKVFSRTQDGGNTWSAGTYNGFGATVYPNILCAISYNNAFVIAIDTATDNASFWKTTDGGANWSLVTGVMNNAPSTFADGVQFWNANRGFCYGDPVNEEFDIYITNDGGLTWNDVPNGNIQDIIIADEYGYNGADCSTIVSGGIGFFITNKGRIYKTIDYGENWTVIETYPFVNIPTGGKIYASSVNYIIVANSSGTTYTWKYTTDGGTTWQILTPESGSFYQYDMCYVPESANMYISTSPYYSYSSGVSNCIDGGLNWTDYTDPLLQTFGQNNQMLGVAFYNMNIGWVGNYNMDISSSFNTILKYYNPNGGANIQTYTVSGNDINIYPNPSYGIVNFTLNGANKNNINISIIDVNGKIVFENKININEKSSISYNFSDLSKGVYFVSICSNNEITNKKLVIYQ